MLRFLALLVLVLALPARAQVSASRPAGTDASVIPDDAPDWLPMTEAIAGAQAEGKLLLVHTYAPWCGWCVRVDREVYTDDAVQAYLAEHYTATRLDSDSDEAALFFDHDMTRRELASSLGVSGTPTTVFVDADGELITKLPGYNDPETFLYALQFVREAAYDTTSFADFVAERRGDGAADEEPAMPASESADG